MCKLTVKILYSGMLNNIFARWPGSTHDSRIVRMSNLCRHMGDNYHWMMVSFLVTVGMHTAPTWWRHRRPQETWRTLFTTMHTLKQGSWLNRHLAGGSEDFTFCTQKSEWHLRKFVSSLVHVQSCTTLQFCKMNRPWMRSIMQRLLLSMSMMVLNRAWL